ncbi:MAG: PD-(D/E)XK nuclease family protein [Anaerolineaceae bacterium]|nr:PD-(D/E)XK nuclease family protein [Anaerolineaceae bacterium]
MNDPITEYRIQINHLRHEYERTLLTNPVIKYDKNYYIQRMAILKDNYSRLPISKGRPLTIPAIFNNTYDENFISDYLAFILNPKQNGIGTAPLESLISSVFDQKVELDADVVEVHREFQIDANRIDFVIELDEETLLVIENKIYASESPGQTQNYYKSISCHYPKHVCYFIFLTPNGATASSEKFKPLSYIKLCNILRSVPYPWLKDVQKGVLWEDFLNHLEEYIIMKKSMNEVSDKSKLYIENYVMIKDLTEAFKRDWPNVIQFLRVKIIERMSQEAGDWEFNFIPRNNWQQVFLKNWIVDNKIYVHYEFHLHQGCFADGKFLMTVDVECSNKTDYQHFRTLFEKQLPTLQSQYDDNGIVYQSKDRNVSIATKWFDFTKDLSKIDIEFIQALDEFLFLTEPINQVVAEMNTNK